MDQNNFMMQITSPITNSENVTKIKTFEVSWIIAQWRQQFNYDVSYLFKGVSVLELFKCNDTGYLFFKPSIEGDSNLYEHLQIDKSYYMPWKWEFEIARLYIKEDINILEIGCGEGHFLDKIRKEYKINVAGIETNLLAVKKAKEKGLTIYEELIKKHSLNNSLKYDIICCFQVLEHISEVKLFIEDCLACLKEEGILIISVPNNNSFISEFDHLLNLPPHHIGFWDEHSLQKISSFFSMSFESIFKEPLQKYHEDFFKSTIYTKVFGKLYSNRISGKLLRTLLLRPFVDKQIRYISKWVFGHTIVAVYRKTDINKKALT